MQALAILLLLGVFPEAPAPAQSDEEILEAAVIDFYSRLNLADPTYVEYWHPEATAYPRAGGILGAPRTQTTAEDAFSSGLEYSLTVRSIVVKIFGGDAAVVTFYTGGTVRNPAGGPIQGGSYRGSMIWIKESGEWKVVHLHNSLLE